MAATLSTYKRHQLVDSICDATTVYSGRRYIPNAHMVWNNFRGRRGGFTAREVIMFVTSKDMMPSNLLSDADNKAVRKDLITEFVAPSSVYDDDDDASADDEKDRPKRQRIAPEDDPLPLPPAAQRLRIEQQPPPPPPPSPVVPPAAGDDDDDSDREADEQFERDTQIVIQLSLMASAAAAAANDDIVLDEEESLECLLCNQSDEPTYRVTQVCTHKYCKECIQNLFLHTDSGVPRCPDCVAEARDVVAEGIQHDATFNLDPFVIKYVDESLCHSRHMAPFLKTVKCDRICAPCPECDTLAYGCTTLEDENCCRCPNVKCAMLFCRACAQPYHGVGKCKAKIDPKDAEYIAKNTRRCPKCNEIIQHFRNHGCHHMTCPTCNSEICYACGRYKYECDASAKPCPIFCDNGCDCPNCDDCRSGHSCANCKGCWVCLSLI